MATIVAAAGGGNWTAGGTWVGGVAPTAADDVQFTATSGNVTIDSGAVCRSADFSGGGSSNYTGTLTHTAAITLTIGDATAGLSSIALKLVSSMTYTLGNATTSAISFVSTSATVQTITSGGKTFGNMTFNATSNGSWQLADNLTMSSGSALVLTKGSLDTNGKTCTLGSFSSSNANTRSLNLGASTVTIANAGTAWSTGIITGFTFTKGTSSISMNGSGPTFSGGGLSYATVTFTGNGATITGANTFVSLTKTGAAVKGDILSLSASQTVTGTLTINGNSSVNRVLIVSSTIGTAQTITAAAATITNADFMDITGAGAASPFTGTLLGDAGGNSGITFTTAATQTWSGTSGGNWSTNAWTTRVPLPQDDVVISSAFSASQTITADMPRLGKSINFTGSTGTPTFSLSIATSAYGSLTLISGMTFSGAQTMTFGGRSSYTITSAGQSFPSSVVFTAPGGTYTLQDNFQTANSGQFTHNNGTFNANNFNVSIDRMNNAGTAIRALTMGSGTWTLGVTTAANAWNLTSTGMTFSGASATIVISLVSTNTRTFVGAGFTYGTLTYTVAGSTGSLVITGANTFNTINFSDATNARTLTLPSATTTTILGSFNVQGTSGKLMSVVASTAASAATLSKASGIVSCDFLSLQDSTATGGASWFAGANSTNVSNNTGWSFTASAVIVAAPGGGNWSATSTWIGGVVPTAASDVQFNSSSGSVTIDVASVCRSLDCSGGGSSNYTATLTHAAAVALSIGNSVAGLSNIALKMVSAMTYTLGNAATSSVNLVSTATTVQTITMGGKVLGNMVINGVGSKYQLADAHAGATITLTNGQFDTNSQTCTWSFFASTNANTRVLTLGNSTITITGGSTNVWNTATTTGLTLNANTSSIIGAGTNASFSSGAATYNNVSFIAGGVTAVNAAAATFTNFTRTTFSTNKADGLSLSGNMTITGTLTLTGNSAINRLYVQSNTMGTTRTITAGAVSITNVDFSDITGAGTAAPFTGTSLGDCLGNSNITFDPPVTQTHVTGAAGSWSIAAKWTSRVPLPQDDVIIDANTTGGFIADMPRVGRNIDFTGYAGSFSQSTPPTLYGSLTLGSTMTVSSVSMTFSGRGTHTITSNGKLLAGATFNAFGGSYTLQDALTVSGGSVTHNSGTLNTNGMAVSSLTVLSGSGITRTLTLGSTIWTLTAISASTIVNISAGALTLNAANSTFVVGTAATNTRIFAGAGLTYGTLTYTVPGSTGELDITGANTFANINFSDASNARTLLLPASTTTTITGNFNVVGTAGKLMSIISSASGTAATLSKASGTVSDDYLSLKDSAATGGAAWYAGANSTDVSNNSGWLFTTAVSSSGNFLAFFN